MQKRATLIGLVLVVLVCTVLVLCQLPWGEWRSLASVRRVDVFPLYIMHYYGDYGFDAFLNRGIRGTNGGTPSEAVTKRACSGFVAMNPHGDVVFGRNFDWHNRQTLLLFTDPPSGYASVSMVDISYLGFPAENPSWSDRRVLLNAPLMPFDGMSERGLAVGMMAVTSLAK